MKNRNSISSILIGILTVVVTALTGLMVGYLSDRLDADFMSIYIAFMVSFLVGMLVQTAIHEAGHLVFGLLTGFRFISYRVLSFVVANEDGKLKTGRYSIPGTLGQCLMGAPENREKRPYFLYNAGGVIFNLLSAVIFYLIALNTKSAVVAAVTAALGMYGLVMLIGNGIPTITNGVANDGMNILEMKKHPQTIDSFYNMLDINEMMMKGTRAKDIPEEMIDFREETLHSGSIGIANLIWKENALMDEHRFEETEKLLKETSENDYPLIGYYRNTLTIDQKYLECLNGTFEDITDKKLLRFITSSARAIPSVMRYLYARALYQGNGEEAEKHLKAFASLEDSYPYRGEYQSEKELMAIAKDRLGNQ